MSQQTMSSLGAVGIAGKTQKKRGELKKMAKSCEKPAENIFLNHG